MNKVWIGLANVAPSENSIYDFDGAYVNVISIADNLDDFVCRVKVALNDMDILFIEIEDVEIFADRISMYEVNEELIELSKKAEDNKLVQFGTFHSYKANNEN